MEEKFIDKLHRIITKPVNIFSGAMLFVLLFMLISYFVGLPLKQGPAPRLDRMREIVQAPKFSPSPSRHHDGAVTGYSGTLA